MKDTDTIPAWVGELSDSIINAVCLRNNWDDSGDETYVLIGKMSPAELFKDYCEWHGLFGWSQKIWNVVNELQKVQETQREVKGNVK